MKRLLIGIACIIIALGVLLVAALTARAWRQSNNSMYCDGDTIHRPVHDATVRHVLWQPPVLLSSNLNTLEHEYEPRVTADGQTMYFVRGKAGSNADLFVSTRSADQQSWSDPQPLTAINTEHDELGPEISRDGSMLIFHSDRPGGLGGFDLWISHKVDGTWQQPQNLGPAVNTDWNEHGAALSLDGFQLVFASNRPREGEPPASSADAWSATLRERRTRHDYDLFASPLVDHEPQTAQRLTNLNTEADDGAPAFSPVGDFLYFCSDRASGSGGFDLYRSRWLNGKFQLVEHLGTDVNSPANELDPALSMAGFALTFSSDRTTLVSATHSDYNLWHTESREVFIEQGEQEPLIDWAVLWRMLVPLIPWLLLALLVLLLLALLKRLQWRKLSLIARCLLASLIAHLILLLLLTFWHITVAITEMAERGGTRVILASASSSNDVAQQILGGFTELDLEPPAQASQRTEPSVSVDATPIEPVVTEPPRAMFAAVSEPAPVHLEHHTPTTRVTTNPIAPSIPAVVMTATDVTIPETPAPFSAHETAATAAIPLPTSTTARADASAIPVTAGEYTPAPDSSTRATIDPPTITSTHMTVPESTVNPPRTTPDPVTTSVPSATTTVAQLAVPLPANVPSAATNAESVASVSVPSPSESTRSAAALTPQVNDARSETPSILPPVAVATPTPPSLTIDSAALTESREPRRQPTILTINTAAAAPTSTFSQTTVELPQLIDLPPSEAVEAPPTTVAINAENSSERQATLPLTTPSDQLIARPDASLSRAEVEVGTAISNAVLPSAFVSERSTSAAHLGEVTVPVPGSLLADVAIPAEVTLPTETYVQRTEENRRDLVERMGGSDATERAVELALRWLASHQSEDGRWAARQFDEGCGSCRGSAKFDTDIATTGLALLCFMGANHTHQREGEYKDRVQRGLTWLIAQQQPGGDLRNGETMYSHGIAAIALCEAYGMTRDPALAAPAQAAVEFICDPRNQRAGGWRYEPGQPGDTSVLGWQIMALHSARSAGLNVPQEFFDMASRWLNTVSSSQRPGLYAYQPGHRHSPSMTAEGMFVQQLLGVAPDEARMQQSAEYVLRNPPRWRDNAPTYYWYYATLALYQHQGEPWRQWNDSLTEQLLAHQRTTGTAAGSWDPTDNWAQIGGRIYQTALCTLSLEVYYRYLPMYSGMRAPEESTETDSPDSSQRDTDESP